MKKIAKLTSAIALCLTLIICFSACGLADLTRSLVSGDETTTNQSTTEQALDTVNATQPVSSTSTTVPSTATTDTTATTQTPTAVPTSQASETAEPTTAKREPTTAKPNTGIKEEPVKDIQDLLFATNENTAKDILVAAGFAYDEEQGIFYTPLYPWQRYFGFNVIYDMAAPLTGMIYDTKRIEFIYDDREWMVQLWKGQYGITAGAEIGLYTRDLDRTLQYDCADDEDLIEMQFDFYNQGKYVFSRGPEKHWWLTGFKVFHVGIPFTITMDMTLKFTDNQMATAFMKALKKQQYTDIMNPIKYKRVGSTIRIIWGSVPDGVEL